MKYYILLFQLSILLPFSLTNIVVQGNTNTKNNIILREVNHPIPGDFDSTIAVQDRNRIYNLRIFSSVNITAQDSNYVISVTETPRFFPIPLIDYDEAKGWSYGAGLKTDNFTGRNETLITGFMFGEDPVLFLHYENPWIAGDHISLTTSILNNNIEHHYHDSTMYQQSLYIGTGFQRHLLHNYVATFGGIKREIFSNSTENNNSVLINQFSTNLAYYYDSRDIKIDPTSGMLWGLNYSTDWGLNSSPTIHKLQYFKRAHFLSPSWKFDPVFTYKLNIVHYWSDAYFPYYYHEYLGGEEFVRGYTPHPDENGEFSDFIEVDNLIYQSLESQFTIFPKKDMGGVELGIDGVLFVDVGLGAKINESLNLENHLFGFGIGLKFFMSGFGYIGIDFGFNPSGEMKIHLNDSD